MTPELLEELRRIAQMARKVMISVQKGHDCSVEEVNAVALYISTFDPMTVLDLLDELEWLWREREEDDDKWTRYEELYVQARGQIVDLQLEIERLRRERDAALDVLGREDIDDGAKVEGVRLILSGVSRDD